MPKYDEKWEDEVRAILLNEINNTKVPPVDQALRRFKERYGLEEKSKPKPKRWRTWVAIASGVAIFFSVILYKPITANALGLKLIETFKAIVGITTVNKQTSISRNPAPEIQPKDIEPIVMQNLTLEEAKKMVNFDIAEPIYLPKSTKIEKITVNKMYEDVYRVDIVYAIDNKYLVLTQTNMFGDSGQGQLYDTDDSVLEDVSVRNYEASFIHIKNTNHILSWYDKLRGLDLRIKSDLPAAEIMKIGEGIE